MTGSRRFGRLAFAKQGADMTSLGTPAAAPLFSVPIISGGIRPAGEYDDLPRIGSNLARLGRFSTGKMGTGTITILAHPEALGLLLYQVTGSYSRSGTTHTYNMQDEYPFPITFWSSEGSGTEQGRTWRFTDGFINRMRLNGNTRQNIEVEMDITAFSYTPMVDIPAVTGTGASAEDEDPRLKYIDSTVKLSPNTSPPTDQYVTAERVMLEMDRAPEYRYGSSLTPRIIVPDRLVNFDAGVIYDSALGAWDWLLEEYVGSLTGTLPTQNTPHGSFDVQYGRHPADPTKYLRVTSNGRNWEFTSERPDAEAQPGILEYDLTGIVTTPRTDLGGTGESEIIMTLINDFGQDY